MPCFTLDTVRASFAAMLNPPPVLLNLEEAATLVRLAPATLSRLVSQGRIRTSVKRGKPLVFMRDHLVVEFMGKDGRHDPPPPPRSCRCPPAAPAGSRSGI